MQFFKRRQVDGVDGGGGTFDDDDELSKRSNLPLELEARLTVFRERINAAIKDTEDDMATEVSKVLVCAKSLERNHELHARRLDDLDEAQQMADRAVAAAMPKLLSAVEDV